MARFAQIETGRGGGRGLYYYRGNSGVSRGCRYGCATCRRWWLCGIDLGFVRSSAEREGHSAELCTALIHIEPLLRWLCRQKLCLRVQGSFVELHGGMHSDGLFLGK